MTRRLLALGASLCALVATAASAQSSPAYTTMSDGTVVRTVPTACVSGCSGGGGGGTGGAVYGPSAIGSAPTNPPVYTGGIDTLGHLQGFLTDTSGREIVNVYSLPAITGAVSSAGSTGLSYSANRPTIPNVGANFAASGPYASYVLVATVPALATRLNVDIENDSGAQIVIVRDDGTAASGSAPANAAVFSLAGGSGVGSQGGSWSSTTFKGRIQVYAASSTAQVAVFTE